MLRSPRSLKDLSFADVIIKAPLSSQFYLIFVVLFTVRHSKDYLTSRKSRLAYELKNSSLSKKPNGYVLFFFSFVLKYAFIKYQV